MSSNNFGGEAGSRFTTRITCGLLLSTSLFCVPSRASLTDIGSGLIYDSTDDVTWISNGLLFSQTFQASDNSLGLIGNTVTTPFGTYTISSADFQLFPSLGNRELATWYGATAWADSLSYQYGGTTITDWRLPTNAEAAGLQAQLGGAFGANTGPFTYALPTEWTSNLVDANTAYFMNNFIPLNGTSSATGFSNVWAVVSGNVATVPLPAAVWLFGSALVGFVAKGRRKALI